MNPEQLVQILVALNLAGLLANLSQWWTRRQDTSTTRRYSAEDRLLNRIGELEDAQAVRETAMQEEIHQLRIGLEECQKQHAAAQVIAAGLKAENAAMQRQLDELSRNLNRREHDYGPPRGQPERRDR